MIKQKSSRLNRRTLNRKHLIIVALATGFLGSYLVYRSFASTTEPVYQNTTFQYAANANIDPRLTHPSKNVTIIKDNVSGLRGSADVASVGPGGELVYDTGAFAVGANGQINIKSCYALRLPSEVYGASASAKVKLADYNNMPTVTLSSSPQGIYRWICVKAKPGTPWDQNRVAVKNLSTSSNIYVYQRQHLRTGP